MKRLGIALAVLAAVGVALLLTRGAIGVHAATVVGVWQNELARHLPANGAVSMGALLAVALVGGAAASISPCILGMLPVTLSFIGAARLSSRKQAAVVAAMFVLGVGIVNVVLGLVASLFFAVFVEHRAQLNIAVGLLTIVMALWLSGLVRIPVPQLVTKMPASGGAFAAGAAFALVASPCASPVLIAVLAVAARGGHPLQTIVAMTAYTVGYTALLFCASISAAVTVASRRLLKYGEIITRSAAAAMLVIGAWTAFYGFSLL